MKSDWYGAQGMVANGRDDEGESSASHRKRVLIADRDETARRMLVNVIESLGYEAVAAESIDDALDIARRMPLDAALIDVGAPMLEGLPVARRMREIVGQSALLLIALTGWGQPQ